MKKTIITRRSLLKKAAALAAGSAILMNFPARIFGSASGKKSRVILIRDENVIDADGKINAGIMQDMLDKAMLQLTGRSSVGDAWKDIVRPSDIVGIKTNVWRHLPTPPELENAIKKRVMEAGVKEDKISIRDRGLLSDPVFKQSTALINVRPMRTHAWSGVGSLIKNYIMFVNNPSSYHDDSCADLATLFELPVVKGKSRLHILVMLTPLFHGVGPHHFNKEFTWPYKGIIVGFDPVAVDSVGLQIIQARRKEYFGEDKPLNPPAKHILLADTRHHLGTADPNLIELVKMGWKEGVML
ncbi:MAG: DUF362 domain-containing protein [Bacteroidales bacterium]|nr:DUF362 domain-containing protein [Bacteroidales bacterium]MBN2764094.1 DUF362 domain-containing protein [Bacteroidales bacterium]